MKLNKLLFLCLLILSANLSFAQQQWCAFDQMDSIHGFHHKEYERLIRNRLSRPGTLNPSEVYRIPVVVHVVHNNNTDVVGVGNNISDEQIFSAIEVLNEDFSRNNADTILTPTWARTVAADFQMEFVLATQDPNGMPTNGITRHRTTKSSFALSVEDETLLKSYGYWPSDQYLNIWVASLSGLVVGYAQFPDNAGLAGINNLNGGALTDGVVIAPFAFGRLTGKANGSNNPYRFGRSTVHEIGHWLGLRHTFNSEGNTCDYTDYCDDTPPQKKGNTGLNACDTTIIGECAARIMFMNYMDYTNDACMNIFTNDQKNRAHTAMEISPRRASLKFSKGLCGVSNTINLPYLESFDLESEVLANWELRASSDTVAWSISNGVLSGVSSEPTADSLVLKSGVLDYKKNEDYILRVKLSKDINTVDTLKIYSEWACSGKLKLVKAIYLPNGKKDFDELIKLKDLFQEGLITFYFVLNSKGNTIGFEEISFYQESNTLEVELFPNPSNGQMTYNLRLNGDQEVEMQVYDLRGKLMLNEKRLIYSGKYALDISSFAKGSYIIRFIAETGIETRRIIIE